MSAHAIGHVHEPVQTLANSLFFSHTFGVGIPAPKYPAKKMLANPNQRATSSRTTYRSRRRFLFQRNAVSPSLRRSSSQNQNRTGAPHLVYNFGIPLCWVLILYGKTVLFVYRIAGKQSTHPGWPFLAQKEGIRIMSAHAIGHVHEPVQTLANSLIFSHTFGGGIPAPKYPAKKCLRIPTSVP